MRLYKTIKKVLSVQNNPEKFLNGLTSNSLDKPQNAFINLHGRIIATFDQIKIKENEFFLILEPAFVDSVLSHLDRYAKLSGSRLEKKDLKVFFDLDGDYMPGTDEYLIPQKKGKLIVTSQDLPAQVSESEFQLFRLKNDIPLLGIDYKDEFLLNINETDFVSFTKGCYLGQEPVSKVHGRSKPSKRLAVKFEKDCSEEEKAKLTSKTKDPQTGQVLGFVFADNR